jgi:cytochrome c-type biogenesis protein CcmH
VTRLLPVALALALAAAVPALASERHPTQAELEGEVMCPVCGTTLDQSHSEIAQRIKRYIAGRLAAGDTKSEIEGKLVDQFGIRILAAPPKRGFNLLAWLLPLAGVAAGAAALGFAAWRWTRVREPEPAPASPSSNGRVALEPELERRLDEELARFD